MRLAMQGAGPRLMPPSATVKVVPRTQLAIKMPDAGAPLMLVLHVKLHKTRCLFLLLCKLFFFFFDKMIIFARNKVYFLFCQGFLFPKMCSYFK